MVLMNTILTGSGDRPIWFWGFAGRICLFLVRTVLRDRIVSIPHPLLPARTKEFAYPNGSGDCRQGHCCGGAAGEYAGSDFISTRKNLQRDLDIVLDFPIRPNECAGGLRVRMRVQPFVQKQAFCASTRPGPGARRSSQLGV
jgi:hypothetical protein